MAELFATISAAIGIADVGVRLSTKLYTFGVAVASADKTILAISNDVALTSSVLKELSQTLEGEQPDKRIASEVALETTQGLTKECQDIFGQIDALLVRKAPNLTSGRDRASKAVLILEKVKWPRIQQRVELLRVGLDRLKSSLLLMLHVLIFARLTKDGHGSRQAVINMETLLQCLHRYKDERESKFTKLRLAQRDTNTALLDALTHATIDDGGTSTSDCLTGNPSNGQSILHWYMGEEGQASAGLTSVGRQGNSLHQVLRCYNQLFSNLVEEVKAKKYEITEESRSRIENQISIARSNELSLLEVATITKAKDTQFSAHPSLADRSFGTGDSARYARRSSAPLDRSYHKAIKAASEPPQAVIGGGSRAFGRSELLDLTRTEKARRKSASKDDDEHEKIADEEFYTESIAYHQVENEDLHSGPLMGVDSQAHRLGRYSSHRRRPRKYEFHRWEQEIAERERDEREPLAPLDNVLNCFFQEAEGIHPNVLENEIAGFLGPEATFRSSTYQGIPGYEITAIRPFTSSMLEDIRSMSRSYSLAQEQRDDNSIPVDTEEHSLDGSRMARWGSRDGGPPPPPEGYYGTGPRRLRSPVPESEKDLWQADITTPPYQPVWLGRDARGAPAVPSPGASTSQDRYGARNRERRSRPARDGYSDGVLYASSETSRRAPVSGYPMRGLPSVPAYASAGAYPASGNLAGVKQGAATSFPTIYSGLGEERSERVPRRDTQRRRGLRLDPGDLRDPSHPRTEPRMGPGYRTGSPPRKRQRRSRDYEGRFSPLAAQEKERLAQYFERESAKLDANPWTPQASAESNEGIDDLLAKWTTVQRPGH